MTYEEILNMVGGDYGKLIDLLYGVAKLTEEEESVNTIVDKLDRIDDEYLVEKFRAEHNNNHHIPLYFVEVGVLLKEDNEEFEDYQISDFYDDKFGFYDENKLAFFDLKEAMDYARKYVEKGVINTYAFVYYDRVNVDEMSDYRLLEVLNSHRMDDMPIVDMDSLIWFISKDEHKEVVGWYLDEHKAE